MMNIDKLMKMQWELDKAIEKKFPKQPGENRFYKDLAALQIELSELANEMPDTFKYWSEKKNNQEKMLEEYADVLSFTLSIGNGIGYGNFDELEMNEYVAESGSDKVDVVNIFIAITYLTACLIENDGYFEQLLFEVLNLGDMLGFTWDQVEESYIAKNKINYERLESDY